MTANPSPENQSAAASTQAVRGSGLSVASGSPLPKTQQELYDAMKAGVTCRYMPYAGRFNPSAYYFRTDTHKRCTAAAEGLLKRGLVEKFNADWRGHELRTKANKADMPKCGR